MSNEIKPFDGIATHLEQALTALARGVRDALKATQEDFQLAPPQPAYPPVGDGDPSQVSGSCKSSTQEAE